VSNIYSNVWVILLKKLSWKYSRCAHLQLLAVWVSNKLFKFWVNVLKTWVFLLEIWVFLLKKKSSGYTQIKCIHIVTPYFEYIYSNFEYYYSKKSSSYTHCKMHPKWLFILSNLLNVQSRVADESMGSTHTDISTALKDYGYILRLPA
jgi:hypothetical protein